MIKKDLSIRRQYALTQQTPLIHFQHNQAGAGIRATELKPKLDRFLKMKYGSELRKEWFLGDSQALNYKVRIMSAGKPIVSETINKKLNRTQLKPEQDIHRMYFGNMANSLAEVPKKFKESVLYEDKAGCSLEIICMISGLRIIIDESIEEFFAITNFGARQNKGFGGFSIANGAQTLSILQNGKYNFFYTKVTTDSYIDKLNIVDAIYSTMKGGLNYTYRAKSWEDRDEYYIKGYIQRQYLEDKKLSSTGSEKAAIKSGGLFPDDEKKKYPKYQYVRAILGVADHYEFKDDRKGTVKISNSEIERYKSPITIKIVDEYIFFIYEDTFDLIKGKTFVFRGKPNYKKGHNVNSNSIEVQVPTDFDWQMFVEGFITYFDEQKEKFVNMGYQYKKVKSIKLINGNKGIPRKEK